MPAGGTESSSNAAAPCTTDWRHYLQKFYQRRVQRDVQTNTQCPILTRPKKPQCRLASVSEISTPQQQRPTAPVNSPTAHVSPTKRSLPDHSQTPVMRSASVRPAAVGMERCRTSELELEDQIARSKSRMIIDAVGRNSASRNSDPKLEVALDDVTNKVEKFLVHTYKLKFELHQVKVKLEEKYKEKLQQDRCINYLETSRKDIEPKVREVKEHKEEVYVKMNSLISRIRETKSSLFNIMGRIKSLGEVKIRYMRGFEDHERFFRNLIANCEMSRIEHQHRLQDEKSKCEVTRSELERSRKTFLEKVEMLDKGELDLKTEHESKVAHLSQIKQKRDSLVSELENAEKLHQEMEVRIAENESYARMLREQEERLSTDVEQKKAEETDCESLNSQISAANDALEKRQGALKKQKSNLGLESEEMIKDEDEKLKQKMSEIENLRQEKVKLGNQLADIETEMEQMRQAQQAEIQKLRRSTAGEIDDLSRQIHSLEEEIQEKDIMIRRGESDVVSLTEDYDRLRQKIQTANVATMVSLCDERNQLSSQNAALSDELTKHQSDIKDAQVNLEEILNHGKELQRRSEDLLEQRRELLEQVNNATIDIETKRAALKVMEEIRDGLIKEVRQKEVLLGEKKARQTEKENQKREIATLQEKKAAVQEIVEEFARNEIRLKRSLCDSKQNLLYINLSKTEKVANLKQELNQLKADVKIQESRLRDEKSINDIRNLEQEIEENREKRRELEDKSKELKKEVENVNKCREESRTRNNEKHENLIGELEELQNEREATLLKQRMEIDQLANQIHCIKNAQRAESILATTQKPPECVVTVNSLTATDKTDSASSSTGIAEPLSEEDGELPHQFILEKSKSVAKFLSKIAEARVSHCPPFVMPLQGGKQVKHLEIAAKSSFLSKKPRCETSDDEESKGKTTRRRKVRGTKSSHNGTHDESTADSANSKRTHPRKSIEEQKNSTSKQRCDGDPTIPTMKSQSGSTRKTVRFYRTAEYAMLEGEINEREKAKHDNRNIGSVSIASAISAAFNKQRQAKENLSGNGQSGTSQRPLMDKPSNDCGLASKQDDLSNGFPPFMPLLTVSSPKNDPAPFPSATRPSAITVPRPRKFFKTSLKERRGMLYMPLKRNI